LLESIEFDNGSNLIRIEESAFSSSGLKSIVIPSSVEILGKSCFGHCQSLESIIFENDSKLVRIEEEAFYHAQFGIHRLKSIVIPQCIEDICRASLGNLARRLVIRNTTLDTPAEDITSSVD
jgi:hypothetical protein